MLLKKRLRKYIGSVVYKKRKLIPCVNKGFRVLAYHSVTDGIVGNDWEENTIHKDLFARQMKYLSDNKYNVISCKQGIEYLASCEDTSAKTVAITFDDGYVDNYTNAFPILKKYNFHATVFLTVNFLQDYSGDTEYLGYSQIMDIKKTGIIDFGSHGLTHRALTMLTDSELDKEIKDAKRKLEDIVNDKIDLFAYPFGHSRSYNKNIIEKVKTAGFLGAHTTIFGLNNSKTNPFLIKRNRISWLDGLGEFEKHLMGAYDWCVLFEHLRYKRYHFKKS